jgi:phosphoribosyl-dephospho-CoA transferase
VRTLIEPRPHDLLRIASDSWLVEADTRPQQPAAWACRALEQLPWVVVRRSAHIGGRLPVRVHGRGRGERYDAWIHLSEVLETVTPEDLAVAVLSCPQAAGHDGKPLWMALRRAADVLTRPGLAWGPVGSVGFELATGTTCDDGILNLVVRAPAPLPHRGANLVAALRQLSFDHGCRIDCQVETPAGAVDLDELTTGLAVLARTDSGQALVDDPWDTDEVKAAIR